MWEYSWFVDQSSGNFTSSHLVAKQEKCVKEMRILPMKYLFFILVGFFNMP
jgi:hypothetical protein